MCRLIEMLLQLVQRGGYRPVTALLLQAPSEQERLRADVDFLAAMQGVAL